MNTSGIVLGNLVLLYFVGILVISVKEGFRGGMGRLILECQNLFGMLQSGMHIQDDFIFGVL